MATIKLNGQNLEVNGVQLTYAQVRTMLGVTDGELIVTAYPPNKPSQRLIPGSSFVAIEYGLSIVAVPHARPV